MYVSELIEANSNLMGGERSAIHRHQPIGVSSSWQAHSTMRRILFWVAPVLVVSFSVNQRHERSPLSLLASTTENDENETSSTPAETAGSSHPRRRTFLASSLAACTTAAASPDIASWAMDPPVSIRPTVYAVDATIPPTLRPVPKASQQQSLLTNLGRGLGTSKTRTTPINLNNILNRVVFGTIDALQTLAVDTSAPASFVCFGVSSDDENSSSSIQLGVALTESIVQGAQGSRQQVAIGLAALAISAQPAVDAFVTGQSDWDTLVSSTITKDLLEPYRSLLDYARQQRIPVLCLAVDPNDTATVRAKGLQALDPAQRQRYVADPTGFIAQTTDPQFGLYTDRVLLRDVADDIDLDANDEDAAPQQPSKRSTTNKDDNKNLFAERILAHEAAATVLARYAAANSKSVVLCFAPVDDLRYMKGINGRLPRIYNALKTEANSEVTGNALTDDDVTTILLNPSPKDTLSETKRLRLEVGTGPDTIKYQMKVADYIWFRSNPPVYLLPRVMDYRF